MVSAPVQVAPPVQAPARVRRLPRWVAPVAGVVAVVALYVAFRGKAVLPHDDDATLFHWLNDARDWVDENRNSSPIFLYVVNYLRLGAAGVYEGLQAGLVALGWPGLLGLAAGLGWLAGGWRIALVSFAGFAGVGVLGFWEASVETLALTLSAVLLSLLFGIPLGIWAGRSHRVRRIVTPVLDVMQIMPTFSYLSPMVLLFLIGPASATIATMIYAMPPAIRITAMAIQRVSGVAVEASESLGATRWQTLGKVRLPLALNTITLGVNQTIAAALSMVPLTALIAAPGLGEDLLRALARVNVGAALVPGVAIVLIAIVLDRMTRAAAQRRESGTRARAVRWGGFAVLTAAGLALVPAMAQEFPEQWQVQIVRPINDVVDWIEAHWYTFTGFLNDVVAYGLLNPLQDVLTSAPWWLVTAAVLVFAWRVSGLAAGLVATVCLLCVAALQLWEHAMETLTLVLVASVITIAAGLALGVAAARSRWFAAGLRPVLDAAQTMPSFSYLLPAVALFGNGRFTAITASFIYAVPVVARLVEDGLRAVPGTVMEAARSAGSTDRQLLWKVQLPMARGSLLLAANQGIVMTLAMVVIGALVGAGALGYDVVAGFAQQEDYGKGLAAGVALVLLGVMLDRITQGANGRRSPHKKRNA
ncbi:glycine betaine/proline transport system permease protein [Microbispora rosea]|uniref:Glycine betaine/proline transport system permease protein n=1 Tax=Microbispora rosea TaxID=58117 RepID=A0A1N7EAD2_9ACTN|nr:ABC transporter permease subunit [Microbispora rosea]GIH47385.1 glycine/betaine ABC transporter permease [Microbispora rosea subsp. rosea]SIR85077.1 glycine betaine/proline transport system permease protein [Microbispora rosea]